MLKEKRVVIVGGTRGIGLAVARLAAEDGAEVVLASSSDKSVEAALAALPAKASGHALDVRNVAAIQAVFEKVGRFDHLVYTAGESLLLSPLAELDFDAARSFFDIRYWGALACVRAATRWLKPGGSIVLTGGTAGRRPAPGFVVGASICGAMESLTRALALELAPLRVNIVVPGFVETDLWSNIDPTAREGMFRAAAAKLPVGRIGNAPDLAEHYVAFMRGAYTTGQSVVVDGGGTLT